MKLVRARESAKTEAKLKCVDSRVEVGETGVGDMHETKFGAPIVFASEEVQTERPARSEVHAGSAGRDIGIRK